MAGLFFAYKTKAKKEKKKRKKNMVLRMRRGHGLHATAWLCAVAIAIGGIAHVHAAFNAEKGACLTHDFFLVAHVQAAKGSSCDALAGQLHMLHTLTWVVRPMVCMVFNI